MNIDHTQAHPRVITLGGDRIYIAVRGLVLLVIAIISSIQGALVLLPPSAWNTTSRVFWIYTLFVAISSLLLFIPGVATSMTWMYIGDLLGFAALAYSAAGRSGAYDNLFFLPLVAAALRLRRQGLLALSALAALLALLLGLREPDADPLALISRVAALIALPLLVHFLAEQWQGNKRRAVRSPDTAGAGAMAHAEEFPEWMQALHEVASTLSTTANATTLLDTLLKECAKILPCRAGVVLLPTNVADELSAGTVLLPTNVPDELTVVAGYNLPASELEARVAVDSGPLGTIIQGGSDGMLPGRPDRAELSSLPTLMSCRTLLLLPLRAAMRTHGIVVLGSSEEQFTDDQVKLATGLAGYAALALSNAYLAAELRQERQTLVEREDQMRRHLNRDLHDGPAQALAAITVNLDFIKRLLVHEPEKVPAELERLIEMSKRANHDVRTLLFELRPLALDAQGLVRALQLYFERFKDSPTKVILESDDDLGVLDKPVLTTLFNITREAVNNALKHAQATYVWVRVSRTSDQINLMIEDDGTGFDVEAVRKNYEERGSFGLLNIEERARLVNGSATIQSTPGQGTNVHVTIPLP